MTVLRTLWLKCSAIQFTFFDNALTEVSVNTYQNIDCSLSTQFSDLVNASLVTITVNMKKELQRKIQNWENTNCIDSRLILNLINWLMRVQRLWVLSTFLILELLKNTKNLKLMKEQDCERQWIHNESETLYHLQQCDSSYEKNIAEICTEHNSLKMNTINTLIQDRWELSEKTIFCTIRLTVTLVLYWISETSAVKAISSTNNSVWIRLTYVKYLCLVIKALMALIHADLFKSCAIKIILLFQKKSIIIERQLKTMSLQYIISITKLIEVEYTLHWAKRLMIVNSEWMKHEHEQTKKQINHIEQRERTYTYTLWCVDFNVEETIYDQQNWRANLMQQVLNSDQFKQNIYKQRADKEMNDNVNHIEKNDLLDDTV